MERKKEKKKKNRKKEKYSQTVFLGKSRDHLE